MIFTVDDGRAGMRLDAYIAEAADVSRTAAQRKIEAGEVTVCGRAEQKRYTVKVGDEISFTEDEPAEYEATPEDIPLDVVYEDEDIIVINKPVGMVVHPAAGNPTGTLVNALLFHCKGSLSGIGGVMRPGIVHRIDKDTSGLIVCAKNDAAHRRLSADLERHDIKREYHALVRGGFRTPFGTVDLPIARHPVNRKKMAVVHSEAAKRAITHYECIESFGDISYLKLTLETGRTHQIRVHMSHLGHPLIGDTTYGGGGSQFEKRHAAYLTGQTLHAAALTLTHPTSGALMRFECPLPEYFERLLKILRGRQ